jgi:COP9 signalosome complex subunit 4
MASPELTAALQSVADSSSTVKTKTYNDLLSQLTGSSPTSPEQHAANLITYIDAILSSSLGIIIVRPLLASVIKHLGSVSSSEVKVKVGSHVAEALQPQLASYEEQDATVREILANGHEAEEDYAAAAKALQGINLDTTQRQVSDRAKVDIWIRIVRYYLEDDDTVSAETALNKIKNSAAAAQVLKESPQLRLLYQLSQARIMDSRRDF